MKKSTDKINRRLFVGDLLKDPRFKLEVLAGQGGLSRAVTRSSIQKPGLALAGHLESLHPDRVQVLGHSEMTFLKSLSEEVAEERLTDICSKEIPALIVANAMQTPDILNTKCENNDVPLLVSELDTDEFIDRLKHFLAFSLSPSESMHGVMVDVFGVGILILGKSGIGKSEIALDLVMRGHRLVADDIVEIHAISSRVLIASGPELIKHHIEVRGLGILNIKDLFGVASVRDTKKIELVVEIEEWHQDEEYDRLGIEDQTLTILDVAIPYIRLPVRPGRSVTSIIEVAARNQLLKLRGHNSAKAFHDHLAQKILKNEATLLQDNIEE